MDIAHHLLLFLFYDNYRTILAILTEGLPSFLRFFQINYSEAIMVVIIIAVFNNCFTKGSEGLLAAS